MRRLDSPRHPSAALLRSAAVQLCRGRHSDDVECTDIVHGCDDDGCGEGGDCVGG